MMKALPNSGFLFVFKPSGITSSQLVQKIKRKLNLQKVGWIFAHPAREKGYVSANTTNTTKFLDDVFHLLLFSSSLLLFICFDECNIIIL